MYALSKVLIWELPVFNIAAVAIIVSLLSFMEYKKRTAYKAITGKIPTVYGLPLLGYLYKWLPITRFFTSLEQTFNTLKSTTYFTYIGFTPFIVTIDPEIIKTMLTTETFISKAHTLYVSIDRAIQNGLITTEGQEWKAKRKLLDFSFSHRVLSSFMPSFNRGVERTIAKLDNLVGNGEQEVFHIIKRTIFQMSYETTMGKVLQDCELSDEEAVNDFNYLINRVSDDMMLSLLNLGFLVRTPTYYQTIQKCRKTLKKLLLKARAENIDRKEKTHEETGIKKSSDVFINQALEFQRRGLFNENVIITESMTMLAGTFETVSTTMYSVLVLLAMHPDVQEKLFEEVCTILPDVDTNVEFEQLRNAIIPYTKTVIDEALRLMPSIPVIGREALSDMLLCKDVVVPKGMQIIVSIFNLHRSKDIWGPNAHEFNPDNFLPENISKIHPYAYIPYAKGLRNCLGWRYANIVLRVLTLRLVRNFKFSTSFKYADLEFIQKLSIRYAKEPWLKIEKRA